VRVEPLTTARALRGPFDYAQPDPPVDVGARLVVPFGRQRLQAVVTALAETSDYELAAPLRVIDPPLPAELVELAFWLAEEYVSTPARALSLMLPPAGAKPKTALYALALAEPVNELMASLPRFCGPDTAKLRRLEKKGLVRIERRVVRRAPLHVEVGAVRDPPALTGDQEQVLAEIGLTPQIVARFVARFGDTVAVLHSRLGAGERHDEWLRLRRGEARICVGPRSAVFAPLQDVGLVIVDEEHDSSYKHEGDPRYDARRVAERRAAHGTLLCGSATPRPESVHALRRVRLPARVDGAPMPAVRLVDMRTTRALLHPDTLDALASARKAIVLLNRRGWSNFLSCHDCGRAWECPDCDVTLVLHRAENALACHHCGHREPVPARCPTCGSVSIGRHGVGTERLAASLPGLPVFRLDADVRNAARVLAAFGAADRGVLVGTQMVAKGHDFPDVGLAVVLDADGTLRFPDFRAEERTFALVTQLAGRAGRGNTGPPAQVLVQTLAPEADAIRFAAQHDSDGFLRGELARREALSYPPFSTLIRIVCAAEVPGAALEAAAAIREQWGGRVPILGPAPLFRLRGKERAQLVIKAVDRAAAIADVRAALVQRRGVSVSVDVDPQ
jgi:primosomal protein N' (replication factor Y)